MEVVSEEVSAGVAPVTVEDREKGALGPAVTLLLDGFLHVEHYRDAVLVVVPDDSLVRVGCIGLHDAVLFYGVLGRLKVRKLYVRELKRLG